MHVESDDIAVVQVPAFNVALFLLRIAKKNDRILEKLKKSHVNLKGFE